MKRPFHPVRNSLLALCRGLEFGLSPVAPVWMPKQAGIVRISVSGKAAAGLRIAQLSDLHAAAWLDDDYLNNIAQQVLALEPHMLVWTGDFFLHSQRQLDRCLAIFAELHKKIPTFAVLGNHDFDIDSNLATEIFERHGLQVLRNRFIDNPVDGFAMRLLGLDDYQITRSLFEPAAFATEPSVFRLLLAHQPATVRLLPQAAVDLQLSGHLHGGQVNLPIIGAPYVPRPGGRAFIAAPHGEVNQNKYHVNRGLGFSLLPIRIGAPPEITLITCN